MTLEELNERLQRWVVWHRNRHRDFTRLTLDIEAIEKAISGLESDREQYVFTQTFLHNKPRFVIARDLGMGPRRVSFFLAQALDKLRVRVEFYDRELRGEATGYEW